MCCGLIWSARNILSIKCEADGRVPGGLWLRFVTLGVKEQTGPWHNTPIREVMHVILDGSAQICATLIGIAMDHVFQSSQT